MEDRPEEIHVSVSHWLLGQEVVNLVMHSVGELFWSLLLRISDDIFVKVLRYHRQSLPARETDIETNLKELPYLDNKVQRRKFASDGTCNDTVGSTHVDHCCAVRKITPGVSFDNVMCFYARSAREEAHHVRKAP